MFGRGHNLCFMSEPTVNKLILKYCDTCSSSCNDYTCLKVGGVEVVTELGLSQSHKAETLYSLVILQKSLRISWYLRIQTWNERQLYTQMSSYWNLMNLSALDHNVVNASISYWHLGVKLRAISTDRLEHLNTKMAKNLGLLNPALTGSTISLDRRSNSSLNVIDNAMYIDEDSGNPYNTLQRNDNHQVNPRPKRTQNAVYDDIDSPKEVGQNQSRTSQTPKKPGRARQRKNGRIFRVVLMFLIVLVAIIALLLVLLLMMGKVGPKCRCRTSNSGEKVFFARYFYQILVHVPWERAGNVYRGKG